MADAIKTTTQTLTREQIEAFVGRNPRAIKLIESLIRDVSQTIPEAIGDVQYSTLFSLLSEAGAKQSAQVAQQVAIELQALLVATSRAHSELDCLRREVEALRAELADVRSRTASTISQLQAQVREALTLSIGA